MNTKTTETIHVENHGSIPESAQYIEESTLIPESSAFDMTGLDTVTSTEETVVVKPDGSVESLVTEEKKTEFGTKKNMPMMVIGAIATVLIGAVAYKSLTSGAYEPTPQAKTSPAVQPSQQKPTYQAGKVESLPKPAMAASSVSPVVIVAPYVSAPILNPALVPNMAPVPTQGALVAPTAPAVVVVPGSQAVVVVPAAPVAPVLAPTPSAVVVVPAAPVAPVVVITPPSTGQVNENVVQIKKLNDRVSVLEEALKAKTASSSVKSPAASAQTQPKKKMSNAAMASQRAEREDRAQRRIDIDRSVASYRISAIKDNLVWLRQEGGDSIAYTVGDNIPEIGRLTSVNEVKMRITAGGQIIR